MYDLLLQNVGVTIWMFIPMEVVIYTYGRYE